MLEVSEVKKTFGPNIAVDGVSFVARPGEILGLLGPNGAGKSTTIAMIAGLLQPDSGRVFLEGTAICGDNDLNKLKLGLVPQELAVYDELSANYNLYLFGALYLLKGARLKQSIRDSLQLVGLGDRARDKVATFSGGMKRRLNIAAALLHDPQALLLDEPTVGVDPQSRNAIFENLQALKKRGKTIVYTTHYMEEAERLCDRIVIIDHGKVIANDSLPGLYRRLPLTHKLVVELEPGAGTLPLEALSAFPEVESSQLRDSTLTVVLKDLSTGAPRVLRWLTENRCRYQNLTTERPDLESVFLGLTGRSLRDT